jgi:hypothetical protein
MDKLFIVRISGNNLIIQEISEEKNGITITTDELRHITPRTKLCDLINKGSLLVVGDSSPHAIPMIAIYKAFDEAGLLTTDDKNTVELPLLSQSLELTGGNMAYHELCFKDMMPYDDSCFTTNLSPAFPETDKKLHTRQSRLKTIPPAHPLKTNPRHRGMICR